jgi:hypothetical protein
MNPAAGGTPRMSTATKAGLFTFLAVLALAAFGYASAALSLPGCVAATRDAVAATGIQGITFGGEVRTSDEFRYLAEIEYPFVVRCTAIVPQDLHATIIEHRYVGMFGLLLPLDEQMIETI